MSDFQFRRIFMENMAEKRRWGKIIYVINTSLERDIWHKLDMPELPSVEIVRFLNAHKRDHILFSLFLQPILF